MQKREKAKIHNYFEIWSGITKRMQEEGTSDYEAWRNTGRHQTIEIENQEREVASIDIKSDCAKKSSNEIQIMIKEELYGPDWHESEVRELGEALKRFKVDDEFELDLVSRNNKSQNEQSSEENDLIYMSLCKRNKGQRLSYSEKLFVYSLMKRREVNHSQLALNLNISKGTVSKIKKELDREAIPWTKQKKQCARHIKQLSWINESIREFTCVTKYPYTARDVSTYLHTKFNIRIQPRIVRQIMQDDLGLSFKLGKSRPVNYNESTTLMMKILFSIKASRILNSYDALINIDETIFSRSTKTTRSWSLKGKETNLMNLCFSNSTSLITSITTLGDVFAANICGSITSERFVEYLEQLSNFLLAKTGVLLKNCLVIVDNASIHRASSVKKYIEDKKLSVAYLPTYSPEMAPVERYFSMLKKIVIKQCSGIHIDWKSEKSWRLLKQSMLLIQPRSVQKLWLTFTFELKKNLIDIGDLIN